MDESKNIERIVRRLEVVIALLLRQNKDTSKVPTLRDQIQVLDSLGLRPVEIASILDKKPKFISKELATVRKPKGVESSGS